MSTEQRTGPTLSPSAGADPARSAPGSSDAGSPDAGSPPAGGTTAASAGGDIAAVRHADPPTRPTAGLVTDPPSGPVPLPRDADPVPARRADLAASSAPDAAPIPAPDAAPDVPVTDLVSGPDAEVLPLAEIPGWVSAAARRVRHRADRALARPWVARWVGRLPMIAVCLAVLLGGVLRFATASHMWLDESLTVEIAHRPVGGLLQALRHDGSPPLYYLILHVWIKAFGDGDVAVRALSGVVSLATLPLAWLAGMRVGRLATQHGNGGPATPRRVARTSLLLFACSPYAIRYGSETRMYSMVVLVVMAFGLALIRALEKSSPRRLALLTLATTVLVYTHYWTFLLIFTVAAFLLLQARRRPHYRRVALRAFAAMTASVVPFAPWMPSFLFQMLHTGTPWAPRVQAQVLLDTVFDWAGPTSTGALLGIILLGGALIGLTARPAGREMTVKPSGRTPGRYLAAIWLVPLLLAYFVNLFGGSAYAERYTGISLPACLLLAALGLSLLPSRRWRSGVLIVASVSGLLGGLALARTERTQASQIADKIIQLARPGDVVAYCPDQLGPAVHRALVGRGETDLREVVYADPSGPALVDWVDYASRMQRANGDEFARQVHEMAGPNHAILLVKADGYRFLEGACSLVSEQLGARRDRTVELEKRPLYEGAWLERFATLN